ncbi:MAG: capsid staple protein [Desulfohalobiaceae bacterium]
MKLFSMKYKEQEREEEKQDMVAHEPKPPEYPYGLLLSLDEDSLDKLGKSAAEFVVGHTVKLMGKAQVKEVVQRDTEQGAEGRVELQVTDLGMELQEDFESAWSEALEEE